MLSGYFLVPNGGIEPPRVSPPPPRGIRPAQHRCKDRGEDAFRRPSNLNRLQNKSQRFPKHPDTHDRQQESKRLAETNRIDLVHPFYSPLSRNDAWDPCKHPSPCVDISQRVCRKVRFSPAIRDIPPRTDDGCEECERDGNPNRPMNRDPQKSNHQRNGQYPSPHTNFAARLRTDALLKDALFLLLVGALAGSSPNGVPVEMGKALRKSRAHSIVG